MQVAEAVHRYGRPLGASVAADLRRRRRMEPQIRATRSAAPTSSSPRRAAPSTSSAARRSSSTESPSWSSTRPTRCSTWASPRTSRRSSPRRPGNGRPASSRPRCRRGSPAIAKRHLTDPVRIKIDRRGHAPRARLPRVRQTAYIVARGAQAGRRSAACSTSRTPTSAIVFCRTPQRGRRAGRDAERRAAIAPRPCTAG